MTVSFSAFLLSFFPGYVVYEILNLIGSVSEGFTTYVFIGERNRCDAQGGTQYTTCTALTDTYISAVRTMFYWGCLNSAGGRSDG